MRVNYPKSPQALVFRTAAGVLLTVSGIGIAALPWDRIGFSDHLLWLASHRRAVLLCSMSLFWVIGFTMSFRAEAELRDGVQNGLWPEEQLEALRRRIPAALYFALAVAVLACFAFVFTFFPKHGSALLWIFLILFQTIARVSTILRNPGGILSSGNDVELVLRDASPVHSEAWGHQRS